ncbi:MAG: serine protease [Kiloniellales bacterium]
MSWLLWSLALWSPAMGDPAIGRLNHAGYRHKQHCTAVLVAPNAALTATHCLQGLDPREAHLLLGYDRGTWQEHLRPSAAHDLGRDLTMICLSQDARATPLILSPEPPASGETLIASGYGSPSVHRLRQEACKVTGVRAEETFRLDCRLAPGNSGGPLLRHSDKGDAVVGIASASNQTESLAVVIAAARNRSLCPK